MTDYRFGFIGCGNMGGALATAVCKTVSPQSVFLTDATKEKATQLAEKLSTNVTDVAKLTRICDFIFLSGFP